VPENPGRIDVANTTLSSLYGPSSGLYGAFLFGIGGVPLALPAKHPFFFASLPRSRRRWENGSTISLSSEKWNFSKQQQPSYFFLAHPVVVLRVLKGFKCFRHPQRLDSKPFFLANCHVFGVNCHVFGVNCHVFGVNCHVYFSRRGIKDYWLKSVT
jgi:hypothetical protein